MEGVPDGLEYVDKSRPEMGFKLKHPNRNRFIPEYQEKLGHMSVTDGVFIPQEAPESLASTPPDTDVQA